MKYIGKLWKFFLPDAIYNGIVYLAELVFEIFVVLESCFRLRFTVRDDLIIYFLLLLPFFLFLAELQHLPHHFVGWVFFGRLFDHFCLIKFLS